MAKVFWMKYYCDGPNGISWVVKMRIVKARTQKHFTALRETCHPIAVYLRKKLKLTMSTGGILSSVLTV